MLDVNNCFTYAYSAGTHADFTQAITADAASTNVIDLWGSTTLVTGETDMAIVGAQGPYLIVKAIVLSTTSVSINFQLVSSISTTMSGASIVAQYRFLTAQMTAGKVLVNQQLPVGRYLRYLGMYFNVFTSDTTLEVVAWLSDTPEPAETVLGQVVPAS